MAENIFYAGPVYVNAVNQQYLYSSQFSQTGNTSMGFQHPIHDQTVGFDQSGQSLGFDQSGQSLGFDQSGQSLGFQQPGHPVQTVNPVTPIMIPVNFVPLGQQLNIFNRAGYQGFAFNVIPGRYVFIPQNRFSSYNQHIPTNEIQQSVTNGSREQSEEWNQAFSRVSETADQYLGRNGITHFARQPSSLNAQNQSETTDTINQNSATHMPTPLSQGRSNYNGNIYNETEFHRNDSLPISHQNLNSSSNMFVNYHQDDVHQRQNTFNQGSFVNSSYNQNAGHFHDQSGNDIPSANTNRIENSPSLHDMFQELVHLYFHETTNWIQAVIFNHPRQTRTRSLLGVISSLVSENFHTVLQTVLNGFFSGVLLSQNFAFRQISETLLTIENSRAITYNLALHLRAHSRIFNIFLSPTRLLGRFAEVVNSTTRWMIMNQTNSIPDILPCPGTRRQTRDRNSQQTREASPERRAFQPPHMMTSQIHPASLPSNHHRTGQRPILMEQMPVTAPVSMTPFAIPVCTGPHHIPVCTTAHIPVCSSQATWSFPACSVPIPTCNLQHIPACSLPQIPIPHHTFPPLFAHHPHSLANHLPRQQHMSPPTTQFTANHNQPHHHHHPHPHQQHHQPFHQRQEEELQMIQDHHRQAFQLPLHHHHPHQTPFTHSPPVVLQEPNIHPAPHDLYGPFQRHYARPRMGGRSGRLRSIPLPPPPYPGFLLHFLAMLSNPPIPHLGRDFNDEATEVENYEALLNLAERLGDAKPKGLTKPEIEQLPAYRFNKENHNSDMDQTNCVVCMCDFENRQLLRVLPCSHEFHAKCVDKWLKTNRTCPICRADATEIVQSD
ncbi:uncharacterized protein LOC134714992 isoform X1 [Mytilus trossulus]|uniref:uncharacterized protein LOC134714992 isoform X1 n=1 Tax=Mytilus trossulus TaxID=6551 RepID=UPI0030064FA8